MVGRQEGSCCGNADVSIFGVVLTRNVLILLKHWQPCVNVLKETHPVPVSVLSSCVVHCHAGTHLVC